MSTSHVMTVTPAVVNDSNGGANYNVAYSTITTGIISQRPITVTAGASSKTYDGTPNLYRYTDDYLRYPDIRRHCTHLDGDL